MLRGFLVHGASVRIEFDSVKSHSVILAAWSLNE